MRLCTLDPGFSFRKMRLAPVRLKSKEGLQVGVMFHDIGGMGPATATATVAETERGESRSPRFITSRVPTASENSAERLTPASTHEGC